MSSDNREPQRHTGFLLRRAQQRHVATWQQVVPGDLTSVQYGVIAVLERRPGVSQKELCSELDLDRSTIADVCLRMQRSGLINRTQDSQDRRRNVLHLTDLGHAELKRVIPFVEAVQVELTQWLTEKEHQQLRYLLGKLLDD